MLILIIFWFVVAVLLLLCVAGISRVPDTTPYYEENGQIIANGKRQNLPLKIFFVIFAVCCILYALHLANINRQIQATETATERLAGKTVNIVKEEDTYILTEKNNPAGGQTILKPIQGYIEITETDVKQVTIHVKQSLLEKKIIIKLPEEQVKVRGYV